MSFNINTSIDLAGFAIIGFTILVIIWNGIKGRGYKVILKAPPLKTTRGIVVRFLFLIATIILFLTTVSLRSGGFSSSDTHQIALWGAISLVAAIAIGAFARSKS